MALRRMKNKAVDLSGLASDFNKEEAKIKKARERATLDLSKIKTSNSEPSPNIEPLDLHETIDRHEVNKIFEHKDKTAHRQRFEERLKRLAEMEQEAVAEPIKELKSESAKAAMKEVSSQEEQLKEQIKELKNKLARLKKIEEIERNLHAEDGPGGNDTEREEKAQEEVIASETIGFSKQTNEPIPEDDPPPLQKAKPPTKKLEFPEGFLWGTATSAYQVEGGIRNNWSQWERMRVMTKKFFKSGKKKKDFICDIACDFWNRYEEDFDLAKKLNNNAIRFGIEWARIQPKKNTWNVDAINQYRKMLKAAKARGFTTVVTLSHWTIPTWFAADDGWEKEENIKYFLKYTELVIKEFGVFIDYWVTLNEPMIPVIKGYVTGEHPPAKKFKAFRARKVLDNLIATHQKTFQIIKKHYPQSEVGVTVLANHIEAASRWTLIDFVFSKVYRYFAHDYIYNNIGDSYTFVGIDYYRRMKVTPLPPFFVEPKKNKTDMNWEYYPEGLYKVLKQFTKYNKPIYIMENGVADDDDDIRSVFIKKHLYFIHKAIEEGVDVKGYFYWSLIDNFEWSYGWEPKFGLYSVDRETFKRKARPSAKVYAKIARTNKLEIEDS